jgi:hypothetical protein
MSAPGDVAYSASTTLRSPTAIPSHMAYLGKLKSSTADVFGCGKPVSLQDEATKLRIWDRILYSYTNRLLTREGDKLIPNFCPGSPESDAGRILGTAMVETGTIPSAPEITFLEAMAKATINPSVTEGYVRLQGQLAISTVDVVEEEILKGACR